MIVCHLWSRTPKRRLPGTQMLYINKLNPHAGVCANRKGTPKQQTRTQSNTEESHALVSILFYAPRPSYAQVMIMEYRLRLLHVETLFVLTSGVAPNLFSLPVRQFLFFFFFYFFFVYNRVKPPFLYFRKYICILVCNK